MTAALYLLMGSCLVLNAVSSLPIDDEAVSQLSISMTQDKGIPE
jgi:hypothetical protein